MSPRLISLILVDIGLISRQPRRMRSQRALPVFLAADGVQVELKPVRLGAGTFNEGWLQDLIHRNPTILPISELEGAFGDVLAVAREVPCGHGFIDNLFVTPDGNIVLVETKLWRNSQMRREVVAQTLDYVAALARMSYHDFEKCIAKARHGPLSLYGVVRDHPDAFEEPEFIDAVATNLRRGRVLAIALGDGIRTETEALAGLLQSHAGAHFTFALVELAIWQGPDATLLVVPRTSAQTVMIERGIVRIDEGTICISSVPASEPSAESISSETFWEALAKRQPALPAAVKSFLASVEPLGVYADFRASLNLKLDLGDRERSVNFGYITKTGIFWSNPASWTMPEPVWRDYFAFLASAIGGTIIDEPSNRYVAGDGRAGPRIERLLPIHRDAWVEAIASAIRSLRLNSYRT